MAKYTTADIRNICLTGGAGAGKTTLVEQMLHAAGVIGRAGRVEDKNTVCDFDDLEKEFGQSFDSAVVHFDHGGAHVNLVDTPGAPDFIARAIAAMPAAEMVAVMVDASAGIVPITRRLLKIAGERGLPRMIVVNKIDHGDDLAAIVSSLQETFGRECLPFNAPADGGKSVIDCYRTAEGASDLGDVSALHTALIDQVVEVDEALMETYLEQGEVTVEQLGPAFKAALKEGHLVPICFTSAREGAGVTELMDVFATVCPSPAEAGTPPFSIRPGDERTPFAVEADASKPAVAHVFKVSSDPYVGKLCVFRVHQGRVGSDTNPRVDDNKKPVRIAHVFKLQGKTHTETDGIIAGDIGAVAKVEEIDFDSVLHVGDEEGLRLDRMPLPKPMYGKALEGTSKGAETKLGEALTKLCAEDPSLEVERVQATSETVLRGLGEQHLRLKFRLLKDRYGVEVDTRPPRVAYKETITSKAEGHHRHKKQTGGAGQFGEVYLRVEPLVNGEGEETDSGLLFLDETFGGSIPKQFLPAIEKGVRQVMHEGAIAGYPMHGIKVSVYDGKHHPVDSKEVAFVTAGRKAFVDAVQKARPVLLEPIVKLEITVPAGQIGDISSDISGRRGRIQGTDMLPGNQAVVTAEAPLSEVMTYSSQLKSMTGGAGSYTMDYSHDERTPPNVQAEVVKAFKPKADED
ncbi:MAG: elongation factor G [Planctomycetota bacterium]|jgi:elongation factor G